DFLRAKTMSYFLFDKSLLPLEAEGLPKTAKVCLIEHGRRFYGCCAAEREQALIEQNLSH
ncbi:hypothetical protein, partial [Pseudomonas sp. QTF5]|uniref:hypothetical protein n=1 Tax=Pseudomonas sp. QTF5 TaxID=1435425 RepID=UPI001C483D18